MWTLPVLFVCENNAYVEFTPWEEVSKVEHVSTLGASYGIESQHIDGLDVEGVYAVTQELVARLRAGEGPFLLELKAFRFKGHYEGDQQPYRSEADLQQFADVDPLHRARAALLGRSPDLEAVIAGIEAAAEQEVAQAIAFARESPYPDLSKVHEHV